MAADRTENLLVKQQNKGQEETLSLTALFHMFGQRSAGLETTPRRACQGLVAEWREGEY